MGGQCYAGAVFEAVSSSAVLTNGSFCKCEVDPCRHPCERSVVAPLGKTTKQGAGNPLDQSLGSTQNHFNSESMFDIGTENPDQPEIQETEVATPEPTAPQ